MTHGISFEPADPSDLDAIKKLFRETVEKHEDAESISFDEIYAWFERKMQKHVRDFERIRSDGRLCGYIYIHEYEDGLELDDFYLLKEYRGRGIGTKVLSARISTLEVPVYLYVFKRNEAAFHLYRKFGFDVIKDLGTRYIMKRSRIV